MAAKPDPASLIECPVVESRSVGEYRLVSFVARKIAAEARPGQFLMVRQAGPSLDPLLPRPLGIHDIESDLVKVLIEPVGKGTRDLASVRVGDKLNVLGPLGNGFDLSGNGAALLVGGGIGAAPLTLLARVLEQQGREVRCLLGFRARSQAISAELFREFLVHVCTEDGSTGSRGLVSEPLKECITAAGGAGSSNLAEDAATAGAGASGEGLEIFACGPDPMLAVVSRISIDSGVRAQISTAAHMACGVGACQGCVVNTTGGYRRTCSEGPVFEAGDLLW